MAIYSDRSYGFSWTKVFSEKMKPKPTPLSDTEQVIQHIQQLDPEVAAVVQTIRETVLATDPEIAERIKWNNPSFYYSGEMKDFDPKEYRRDMIVMNLHKNRIMLVFPSGAKVGDTSGFLEGNYADGRRTVVFTDREDVLRRAENLRQVILNWLQLIEK
ncbi:MAG: DUF1801 domain-containing protein [Bacteroidetes bacterium]|nr:MAG: DUF1801 domain-containing protein [Bacteroidota bacterium]